MNQTRQNKKTLVLVGHYCATGGISIHIRRLEALLADQYNIQIIDESRLEDANEEIFNLRNKKILGYLNRIRKSDVVHIHSTVPFLRFFHVLVGRILFKRVILTIHSLSTVHSKKGKLFLSLTSWFAHEVIAVSEEIKNTLKIKSCSIIPAFIPPVIDSEPVLPNEIKTILNKCKQVNIPLAVSNAYRLNIHNDQDLYGLDLILEAAKKAQMENFNIFFMFIITSLEVNKDLFLKYMHEIDENNLENYIYLYTKPISFVRLILESDLVIRATNTDGDAITIRESLFLGKSVIASDVVIRPAGTILFENRNSNDLYSKIKTVTENKNDSVSYYDVNLKEIYSNLYIA